MNRLSKEKSAYLKHSAYQGIDWYSWSEEAFEKARADDKPVFLSSGAAWCHWCHVMAEECFEDEEIVKLLNENFVCIKIDRDERPDIDKRFQRAVAAMGSGGGWPLSIFLTPDKKPFFGGTYFPPEDSYGRPGFKKVLRTIADFYESKKADVYEYSLKLMDSLKPELPAKGELDESLLNEAVNDIVSEFDPQNGGFGAAPKFPMPGAVEFLINRYFFAPKETIKHVVKTTLTAMAKGGIHDHIGGGFHRYSTDEAWVIPHFEKMADDNAWLLRNYIYAYGMFGDEYFRQVAEGIGGFIKDVLSAPEGGFYASQDADVRPDDEGGYFTWRDEELKNALDDEEYRILSLHLVGEKGAMHHDASKKVLFTAMEPDEIAVKTGMTIESVREVIASGKAKLLAERKKRNAPFVDTATYVSLNGMLISAWLLAYRVFRDNHLKEFALLSLEKVLKNYFKNGELFHSDGVKAILDDYVHLTDALIAAYEITGEAFFLSRAEDLMGLCLGKFWDKSEGGFFDTEDEIAGLRLKSVEDIPHPSANSLGILLLLKLYSMTEKEIYRNYSETALKAFSRSARDTGIHSAYYFCALDAHFNMLRLILETSPESALAREALSDFIPYLSVYYKEDNGLIIPCSRGACHQPVGTPAELRKFLGH